MTTYIVGEIDFQQQPEIIPIYKTQPVIIKEKEKETKINQNYLDLKIIMLFIIILVILWLILKK
jgi:hypothetical protein